MNRFRPFQHLAVSAVILAVVATSTMASAAPREVTGNRPEAKANISLLGAADGVRQVSAPGTAEAIKGVTINGEGASVQATAPPTCWTQFAPTWPAGLPMAHYYRNCNGVAVFAFGGYQVGSTVVNLTGCYYFPDGDWALWGYTHTNYPGANFGTFPC